MGNFTDTEKMRHILNTRKYILYDSDDGRFVRVKRIAGEHKMDIYFKTRQYHRAFVSYIQCVAGNNFVGNPVVMAAEETIEDLMEAAKVDWRKKL